MPRALIIRAEGSPFGTRLSRVLRTMLDEGWHCDVLYAKGALGRSDPTTTGRDLRTEVRLHEFPVARSGWARFVSLITGTGYFGTAQMRRTIWELISACDYDLVVVKDSPALGAVFQALDQTGRSRAPVICEMVEPRIAQTYDSLIRYGTWVTRLSAYARRIIPRLAAAERDYLPRCDRVFVVCDEMKQWLLGSYPIMPDRIAVVQNVEILSVFDATTAPGVPPRRGTRVSFVGTFGPHRGVEVLIEAAGRVRLSRPATPFSLALVGGSRREIQRLERLCQAHGVLDIAELVPYVPHALAMQWIKETDLGVIPHADTPGIRTTVPFKLFQYMAAGAACLVSDVGPLGRIVREAGSGLVARAGSVDDLTEKLGWLLDHPEEAHRLGAAGRRRSEESLRWEIEAREYIRYFRSLDPPSCDSPETARSVPA